MRVPTLTRGVTLFRNDIGMESSRRVPERAEAISAADSGTGGGDQRGGFRKMADSLDRPYHPAFCNDYRYTTNSADLYSMLFGKIFQVI